jgi:hypothetical protein
MSDVGLSPDLQAALEALSAQSEPEPALFERVARWRRACGDSEAAATWQTWSLLPPEPQELRTALATLWRRTGAVDRAAALLATSDSAEASWPYLALLVQQQRWDDAIALQQSLLKQPPSLDVGDLMELLQLWQQAERPQEALDLLQPLVAWMERRGTPPSAQLCNAMADLLEKQQRFNAAEPWWQRSHALQPHQAWPLMRLGHQALRSHQPAVAYHYASQALERDPGHAFAPQLRREALEALGAEQSLALLDGDQAQHPAPVPLCEPPAPETWQGCRRLALIGFRDAAILSHWPQSEQPSQLWLIASPDPLWLERQAQLLLAQRPTPVAVQSWPLWEEQRHHTADLVLEATPAAPGWTLAGQREPS